MRAARGALVLLLACLPALRALHTDPGTDTNMCLPCSGTEYCNNENVHDCPLHSTSIAPADDIEDCTCDGGHLKDITSDPFVCGVGQPPYYYQGGVQYACDPNSGTTLPGQDSADACKCNAGYATIESAQCDPCPYHTYQHETGQVFCHPCDGYYANSGVEATASDSPHDCECNAGYGAHYTLPRNGGKECVACAAGKYKENREDTACQNCALDTFQIFSGRTSCDACPTHMSAPEGSDDPRDCKCNAGYEADQEGMVRTCNPCDVGTSQSARTLDDNDRCDACPSQGYAEELGSTACRNCATDFTNMRASQGDVSCVCEPGHFLDSSYSGVSDYNAGLHLVPTNHASNYDYSKFVFTYAGGTSGTGGTETRYMHMVLPYDTFTVMDLATTDHAHRILLNESFRVLEFSNWGMGDPSSSTTQQYSVEIQIWRPDGAGARVSTPQTLTLTFSIAAGEDRVVLDKVTTSAHETTPYDMPVLPRYIKIAKDKLAGRTLDFGTQRDARNTYQQDYIFSPEEEVRASDFWEPYYNKNPAQQSQANAYYGSMTHYFGNAAESNYLLLAIHSPLKKARLRELTAGLISKPTCSVCAIGKYAPGAGITGEGYITSYNPAIGFRDACRDCPPYSTTTAQGSSSISACTCNAGYTSMHAPFENACWHCESGKYKPESGSAPCTLCPSNSQQEVGYQNAQTTPQSCKCNVGYTGIVDGTPEGTCDACAPGTYKDLLGPGACQSCDANTYSGAGASACTSCPDYSRAETGSDDIGDCKCNAGYELNEDVCDICEAGKFSTGNGDSCQSCAGDSIASSPGASSCNDCPTADNKVANDANTACVCNIGYKTLSGGVCQACPAGRYQDEIDKTVCKNCIGGYKTTVNADRSQEITAATSVQQCACKKGYFIDGDTCTTCADETYLDVFDGTECFACPDNTRTSSDDRPFDQASECRECAKCAQGSFVSTTCTGNTDTGCTVCPDFETTTAIDHYEGISACLCQAGYESNSGTCEACSVGQYKDTTGDTDCIDCSHGFTPAPGETDPAECQCNAGYTLSNGACTQCAAGTYKPARGDEPCTACPTWSHSSGAGSLACVCANGYEFDVETQTCVQCDAGYYKNIIGNHTCAQCDPDKFAASSGTTLCSICPPDSSTLDQYGSEFCVCNAGYEFDGTDGCTSCPSGKFKQQHDEMVPNADDKCQLCTTTCDAGYRLDATTQCTSTTNRQCILCQDNSQSLETHGNNVCPCNAGYELDTDTATCEPCARGTYSTAGTSCQACPGGQYQDQTAQSSCDDCTAQCGSGQYIVQSCTDTSNIICDSCLTCESGGVYEANSCDGTNTTADGTPPDPCAVCTAGHYCVAGETVQRVCGNLGNTPPGTDAPDQCGCSAGQYVDNETACDASCCVDCIADYFCYNGYKTQCPDGTSTDDGFLGSDLTHCHCPLGHLRLTTTISDGSEFNGNEWYECQQCSSDTYCPRDAVSETQCPVCAAGDPACNGAVWSSTSSAGSDQKLDCKCPIGYYKSIDPVWCTICPPGTFCADGDQLICAYELQNSHGSINEGQSSIDSCTCNAGFYRYVDETQQPVLHECQQCLQNNYCDGTGNLDLNDGSMQACFLNSLSDPGSDEVEDCICKTGWKRRDRPDLEEGYSCRQCSKEEYCYDNVAYLCPDNSDIGNGLTRTGSPDQCICDNGYAKVPYDPANPDHGEKERVAEFACELCTGGVWCRNNDRKFCNDTSHFNGQCFDVEGVRYAGPCFGHDSELETTSYACECMPGFYLVSTVGQYPMKCRQCPAGTFCQGYGNLQPQPCAGYITFDDQQVATSHERTLADGSLVATSPVGSTTQANCKCQAGFYREAFSLPRTWVDDDGSTTWDTSYNCVECPANSYCPGATADQQALQYACPNHDPGNGDDHSRLVSAARSSSINDCTCNAGKFIKNAGGGEQDFQPDTDTSYCKLCPSGAFCVGGTFQYCTARWGADHPAVVDTDTGEELLWTQDQEGSTSESACVCKPGYFRYYAAATFVQQWPWRHYSTAPQGVSMLDLPCEECPQYYYCPGDGIDSNNQRPLGGLKLCDSQQDIYAPKATSPLRSTVMEDCECKQGYAFVAWNAHRGYPSCSVCVEGTYKDTVGNIVCDTCRSTCELTVEYETQACTALGNRQCSSCRTCDSVTQYRVQPCTSTQNTECADCRECTPGVEYQTHPCDGVNDRECTDNPTDPTVCTIPGQYLKRNEAGTNSCEACNPIQQHHGVDLWEYTDPGTQFNDPASCPLKCSPHAYYDSTTGTCHTCQTGNVLLRNYEQPDLLTNPRPQLCPFTCVTGTTRNESARLPDEEDCVIAPMQLSEHERFTHTVGISDVTYTESEVHLRITHTRHSRVVVFVGRARVGGQSECTPGYTLEACCAALATTPPTAARVSGLGLAGLASDSATCSASAVVTVSDEQYPANNAQGSLLASIAEDALEGVASCAAAGAQRECTLHVTLFDTVHMRGVAHIIKFMFTKGNLDFFTTAQEYLPLDEFDARVQLLSAPSISPAGDWVYELRLRMSATEPVDRAGEQVRATFVAPSLTQVTLSQNAPPCERYARLWDAATPTVSQYIPGATTLEWTTYWSSPSPLSSVAFALRLDAYDGTQPLRLLANTGLHRDLTLLRPLCTAQYTAGRIEPAALYIGPGLRRDIGTRMRYINSSKYTEHGDGPHDGMSFAELPADAVSEALFQQARANTLPSERGRAARLVPFLLIPRTSRPTTIQLRVALSAHISQEQVYNVEDDVAQAIAVDAARPRDPLQFTPAFHAWCSSIADHDGPNCVIEHHYAANSGAYFADITLNADGTCSLTDEAAAAAYIYRATGAPVSVVTSLGFISELCAFAAARVRPGQRHFGLGFVALKFTTSARRFDENLGKSSKSFLWIDAVATSL